MEKNKGLILDKIPQLLNIPQKLFPLLDAEIFNSFRYFLLKGGRGGGKSQSIARFILFLAEKYSLRICCGRETQNSISESVYSLLADLIRQYQLNFEIYSQKIVHRTSQSSINFRGFREQGAFNIQGMEGIDILWIDEAQALTKQTLDVLIPTIRKNQAKIIFTMNPHVFNDPIVSLLTGRDDCMTFNVNYTDNEFCPAALIKEADECKKRSEKDYAHIWLGEPLEQSDDALFSLADYEAGRLHAKGLQEGYGIRVAGFDIARYGDDTSACFIWQQQGSLHWEELFVDQWGNRDLNYTSGRILSICNEYGVNMATVDVDGLGAGPFDTLSKGRGLEYFVPFSNPAIGYRDNQSYGNQRTLYAYKLKTAMADGHRHVKTKALMDELSTLRYTFDHNQRRILVSKEQMRKQGVKSPNLADACIMAESLIGQVRYDQQHQYEPAMPSYSKEESLIKLAGVR